jgi:uncharacterized protein (TIGR04255 family)
MATRGKPIPAKLKHDAIVEAVFEIRFDTPTLPEVFFGRLADQPFLKAFEQRRMPAHDIPASLREADPNLRYQPIFELAETAEHRAVRIGQRVLSYHRTAPYVGWVRFKPELTEIIAALFAKADNLAVSRLGFRYINALQATLHSIRSIADLDLTLAIADEALSGSVNINFTTSVSDNTQCTVRVATTDLVQGALPHTTSVLVDVDVFTKESFRTSEEKTVRDWIDFAHMKEKEQFFRLLTDHTIDALKEE